MSTDGLDPAVHALRRTLDGLRGTYPTSGMDLERQLDKLLGMMPRFSGHFLYIYDYRAGGMAYHRGFDEVLGYTDAEVCFDLLYRTLHPEDAPIIARLSDAVIRAMDRIRDPKDLFDTTLSVDYRVRKKSGAYIKVLRQTAVFEVDKESGKVISTFSLCKDISPIKTNTAIGWQIHGNEVTEEDLEGLLQYLGRMRYHPSPREIEVLRRLALGKASKEIAVELDISEHTVSTHRRNLLQRTGLKNTAELIRRAVEENWT
jgi:DNA-binding CsgD family transcriptional regulator